MSLSRRVAANIRTKIETKAKFNLSGGILCERRRCMASVVDLCIFIISQHSLWFNFRIKSNLQNSLVSVREKGVVVSERCDFFQPVT